MIQTIFEFIGRLLLAIVLLFVLLPVVWIVTSPFILVGSIFVRGQYADNVMTGYEKVSRVWLDWGLLVPF